MTDFPIPWLITALTSLALLPLLRATRLPRLSRAGLATALGAMGVIGVLLGLRLSFEIDVARLLQPLVAVLVPPAFWLGFAALTVEDRHGLPARAGLHGAGIALAFAGALAGGADIVLPLLTVVYLVLLIRLSLRPDEAFPHLTASDLGLMRAGLAIVIALFALVTLTDLTILIAILTGADSAIRSILTGASGVMTLFVFGVALVGVPLVLGRSGGEARQTPMDAATDDDHALLARFDALLTETRLFTDSGLTLARAARRLGVPARALSQAVNRVEGQNFSRHINRFRVEAATDLLTRTELPVTDIMLEAGFLTKSTFNTEFRRVTGQTPSEVRAAGK